MPRVAFELACLALAAVSASASAPARAQDRPPAPPRAAPPPDEPARPASGAPPPGAGTAPGASPAGDPPTTPLLHAAVDALAAGDLAAAEAAFRRAELAESDPGRRAFAASLAERVRALRLEAAAGLGAAGSPPVDARARAAPPSLAASAPDDERVPFLAVTTALGLGLYGWALPFALGLEEPRAFVGLYLVTGASAFVVPYVLTKNRPTTTSQLSLSFWGGTRGAQIGVMLANAALGARAGNLLADPSEDEGRVMVASATLGSVAGLGLGRMLARRLELTTGQTRLVALGGDFGILWGFGVGHLLDLDRHRRRSDEPDLGGFERDPDRADAQARGMSLAGLVGGAAGIAGGAWLGSRRRHTWGDGEVMRMGGVVGAFTTFSIATLLDSEGSSEALVVTLMLGNAGGLVAGDLLVRDTDFGAGRSLVVDLSAVLGGFAGAGLALLVLDSDEPGPYLAAGSAGAIGGYAFSYLSFRGETPRDAGTRRGGAPPARFGLVPQVGPDGRRGLAFGGVW